LPKAFLQQGELVTEAPRLKPQELIEILDSAFRHYRENFALFIAIVAIIYIPSQILLLIVAAPINVELQTVMMQWKGGGAGGDPSKMKDIIGHSTTLLLLSGVFQGLVFPIATGALTLAVSRKMLRQPVRLGECYGFVFRNLFRLLGSLLLSGLASGLGYLCCIVPGIFLSVWFVFTSSVVVLEGLGGTTAMGRSRQLSVGHGWRIVGLFSLLFIVNLILGGGLGAFSAFAVERLELDLLHKFMAQTALQDALTLLLTPFPSIAWILLYYDIRIRNEAFDLETRLDAAERPASPPLPPTPPAPAAAIE
jgi:hypothetical protein